MFNLEHAISEWRQQMLAAGIQTPTPLEELESHLRDDIEQRTKLGQDEADAFQAAAQKLGRAVPLKTEFARADGFLSWRGDNGPRWIDRVLAVMWMTQSVWFLARLIPTLCGPPPTAISSGFFVLIFVILAYAAGVFGSFYLFRGEERGRKIIGAMALLGMFAFVVQIFQFRSLSLWGGNLTLLNVFSIWLLRDSLKSKPAAN